MLIVLNDKETQFIIASTLTAIETTLAALSSEELAECQKKTATEMLDIGINILKQLGVAYIGDIA